MKRFKIRNGRYLVAVSGGPDSMALLDMCYRSGNHVEAGHVNYHARASADDDERLVRRYCRERGISFHRLNVYPGMTEGNFQQYARNVRYEYFAELCRKNRLEGVLVAHHKDDLIETYLMQKQKNIGVEWYGLKDDAVIAGVRVLRPLLGWEKSELIDYCESNGIAYGIDESNLTDRYARNRVRHSRVEKMDSEEKKQLLQEIDDRNRNKLKEEKSIRKYLQKDCMTIDEFRKIPYPEAYLRHIFPRKSSRHYEEMIRQILDARTCMYREGDRYLVKEYERIYVFEKPQAYRYVFSSSEELKRKGYGYFRITGRGDDLHGVTLDEKDFPVVIRNHETGDFIRMRYGKKKINRFFIDRKIPYRDRLCYPVMTDGENNVILVPGMGCDMSHYSKKHDLYVIELGYYGR